MAKIKMTFPNNVLKGGNHYMTLDYGYTYSDGSFHKGIDLVASNIGNKGGDYIVAFANGKVTGYQNAIAGFNNDTPTKSMGNYVIIDHGNGYKTRYMHMLKGSIKVKTGDTVKKGQVIGYMGNTGNSYGRHLHFDISYNKKITNSYYSGGRYYLDPKPFLRGTEEFGKVSTGSVSTSKLTTTTSVYYTVNVNTLLNVRKAPSVNAIILGMLKKGEKVKKVEVKGDWTKIEGRVNGWVMTRYLKEA